jgi:chorismate synthase
MWGNQVKISIFGESHGAGIGVVLDGLPAGEPVDRDAVLAEMARRAPGRDAASTARREADEPEILSGLLHDKTTGAPLCAVIRNTDTHSADYDNLLRVPRPGHADYTARIRYGGFNDLRGGGHFSGRLTAPLTFAGAVCRQILARRGVIVGAHLRAAGGVEDLPFDPVRLDAATLKRLHDSRFPLLDPAREEPMRAAIEAARRSTDSVGGIVECAALGMPAGVGDPIFGGVENRLSSLLFGIPAVKGIEFGEGFHAAALRGSENNDPFVLSEDGRVSTETNRHGGILGGITSGMPLVFRLAFKPTPSIALPQRSVDLVKMEETRLEIHGRHDPCVAVRAVPVVEAATALCLLDLLSAAQLSD